MIEKLQALIGGNYNQKQIKKLERQVQSITRVEGKYADMTALQLQDQFKNWKEILSADPTKIDDLLPDVFAGIRRASEHLKGHKYEIRGKEEVWNMVHYDVQLIGGIVLHQGKISEMKTGEGKTLVSTLAVILNALTGRGVHVVTVNDYLAQRDKEWMAPLYEFCGLTVGCVINGMNFNERREAYASDITYGTNNEFGFDYLRDNMAQDKQNIVQRDLVFAIVDEVDSILIDEARTPLIISTAAEESTQKYLHYSKIIPQLKPEQDYKVDLKHKSVTLTETGIKKLEELLGVGNLFIEKGFEEVHHIEQALKAHVIFEKDKDYLVQDGKVIIIDEFTGRMMEGRRYSDGLHQSLEAKEGVAIQRESKTLATITFQNYFRLYEKLSGMAGTAETEAEEFAKIYSLDVIVIPTNQPIARTDLKDKIFKNQKGKFSALTEEVKKLHEKGQPVLIGTVNIDTSELLSHLLKKAGIPHEVLNAKHHEREAEIVSKAGQKAAVTVATNMAGRGTDIKLGQGVKELGGLAILGTERHESRRIDNQLRGRSGRQGDPGFSQFYISMQDELMRRFGGEKMGMIMERLGLPEDEAIENGMITRSVENAQKKIEGHHFDARKHVLQYDDVMNIHRTKIYAQRKFFLYSENILEETEKLLKSLVEDLVAHNCLARHKSDEWDLERIISVSNAIYTDAESPLSLEELDAFESREEIQENVENYILAAWDKKKETLPTGDENRIIRFVILKSIDELWLEHIDQMTQLRDKVALSGYAQREPIMEYKREGYDMFKELLFQIKRTAIQNLFRMHFEPHMNIVSEDYSDAQTNNEAINQALTDTNELNVGMSGNLPGLGGAPLTRQQKRALDRK